ncbi:hypothetical protein EPD60_14475 [Flaviaesturariibacter flavus]|uniref:Uncharacterized protein n=1 Tax=Flaviaesturariibacter flavus TaxID=2502780 RepID=A0A4R1B7S2_9BACT|nr:hypothetical protein EPD60_14475 [Flaviaesturariibacter flavus]
MKISDLKPGDVVRVLHDGGEREGVVTDTSRDENMACINNGVQEFWYPPEEIVPIPMSDQAMTGILGFEKEMLEDGSVKYKKGPFRVLLREPGNYTNMEVWYREDRRHFHHPLYLHELQNHHLQMTKMTLERGVAQ